MAIWCMTVRSRKGSISIPTSPRGADRAMSDQPIRVLWLLNHATLRRFEVGQLRALGISEIYCPKRFPYDEANFSASVDYSLDASLSIPESDLRILNVQDWYTGASEEAWRIANRYFQIAISACFPELLA